MLKTYYDILRVPRNATKDEITQAYEEMIDKCSQRFEGEDFDRKADILDKAFDVLAHERKRVKYDNLIREMEEDEEEQEFAPEPEPREETVEKRRPVKTVVKKMGQEEEDNEPKEKKKLTGLIIAIAVAFLLIAGGGFYFYNYIYLPESHYKDAAALVEAGKYDDAIAAFTELKDYKDSTEQIKEIKRRIGFQFIEEQNYEEAMKVFNTLGTPEDIAEAKKAMAASQLSAKQYDQAMATYQEIGDTEGVNNAKYTMATDYLAEEKKDEAFAIFKELGEYKDSAGKVTELKEAAKTEIVTELGNISESQLTLMSFDNAKQSVIKLSEIENMAKTYGLEDLYSQVDEKWLMVDSLYYGVYARNMGTGTKNDTYFESVAMTSSDSVSKAPDNTTTHFSESPEYVSLYVKCLPGAAEKELNVTWYQYKLDHATGEYTERTEVAKSEAQTLPEIKKNYSTIFAFEKNAFTYGAGFYAAEITAAGDSEPCATVYFYVQ